jgi:chromosome segregation ATPase
MPELNEEKYVEHREASGTLIAAVVAVLLAVGALGWCLGLQNHLSAANARLAAADDRNADLARKLDATNAQLQATSMTQKQLEARASAIMASEKAANARIEQQQQAAAKQIGAVASDVDAVKTDVGGVKTDVGGVKTDVATTRQDLEDTKVRLQSVVGDEGKMSGLIATNHDELEYLKHKGDRNYIEFTLHKGAQPTLLATIKLQLKKADQKHSRFTLNVSSNDKTIEKKDKTIDEPLQFYTGKDDHALYEVVVNTVDKNTVTGYISTPNNAPQGLSMP